MANLTAQEIEKLAKDAGFSGDALRWAVAVALAESGGNPGAYNPEIGANTPVGSGSRGLWQIYGVAHPEYNSSIAFDPVTNAKAAYQVYKEAGNSFSPWSTFNNGMAQPYYNQLEGGNYPETGSSGGGSASSFERMGYEGTGSGSSGNLLDTAAQTANALSDIASGKFITNIFADFDKTSFVIGAAGSVLIVIGLTVIFIKPATELTVQVAKGLATKGIAAAL